MSLLQAAEGGVEPRVRLRCVCGASRSLRPWLAPPCVARPLRSLRSRPWPLAVRLLDLYRTTPLRGSRIAWMRNGPRRRGRRRPWRFTLAIPEVELETPYTQPELQVISRSLSLVA